MPADSRELPPPTAGVIAGMTARAGPGAVAKSAPRPPASYRLTRQIFLRGMGIIYLIAILSLWVQIDGLIGSHGILPVSRYLELVRRAFPDDYIRQFPTLCWLNSSDGFLHLLCAAGSVLSLLVIAGVAQAPALAMLWVIYLSLAVAGQEFYGFQWDYLLLEAGLLSVFLAPLQMVPRVSRQPEPSRVVLWLTRWLLFRLMFLSGLLKLLSGDPSWRDGTAMNFHYLTQPLPAWTSYYAYQLPHGFQWLSVWSMFGIELVAPFFIFTGRRSRQVAFALILLLQLLIMGTGNFGFFNLLAIVLCLPLLDDAAWPRKLRVWVGLEAPPAADRPPVDPAASEAAALAPSRFRWPLWVTAPLAAVLLLLTAITGVAEVPQVQLPDALRALAARAQPFRSANGYGLFRVMTTVRNEIVIEGSDDGRTWQQYEFKYKPGDVEARPRFCIPHMPRLDWQMWFGAFGEADENRWFIPLLQRLHEGEPCVLALLDTNPFPARPPRYVRAVEYNYTFAPPGRKGVWWRRRFLRVYFPALVLEDVAKPDELGTH